MAGWPKWTVYLLERPPVIPVTHEPPNAIRVSRFYELMRAKKESLEYKSNVLIVFSHKFE